MTLKGLKIRWVKYCVNKRYCGTLPRYFEKKRKLLNSIGYELEEGVKIVGPLFCTGKLKVGKDTWIGRNFTVHGNGTVTIGKNCDIAPEVVMQTGGHEIGNATRRAGEGFNKDINVGNGCWIGVRATVLGGVNIGDGSVIGACTLVNKNIESNTLAAGVPAKTIRKLEND